MTRLFSALLLALVLNVNASAQEWFWSSSDFSSPEAAIQSFIQAGANRDRDILRQCFAQRCEKEFHRLRDGRANNSELTSLQRFVKGARVLGAEPFGLNGSIVTVQFSSRLEEISLTHDGEAWRITGF